MKRNDGKKFKMHSNGLYGSKLELQILVYIADKVA